MTDVTIRESWTTPAAPAIRLWISRLLRRAEAAARLGRIRAQGRTGTLSGHLALSDVRQMADLGADPRAHRDRDNWADSILRHSFR